MPIYARLVAYFLLAGWVLWPGSDSYAQGNATPTGDGVNIRIDITNVVGHQLPGKVELRPVSGKGVVTSIAREGRGQVTCPPGEYQVLIYVYESGVPFLADVQRQTFQAGQPGAVLLNLAEGAEKGKEGSLAQFDKDGDLALDRAEVAAGTDPDNPSSLPGRQSAPFPSTVLEKRAGWYRGELHAHSKYGGGSETVGELVRRAEAAKLDFLAIADRNTLASALDPEFKSNSVALIPAMEWGTEQQGIALLYGPGTVPGPVLNAADAQALVWLVQTQGGAYAVAHPCFEKAPWLWGLANVNAIEVWCREWAKVPPATLARLGAIGEERTREKRLVYPLARAVATQGLSANGQAALYYEYELQRGLRAGLIGGSMSSDPKVALAEPVTWVYAEEKSARGIVDGIRRGRTFVSHSLDGPTIEFAADAGKKGSVNVVIGDTIPVTVESELAVMVRDAKGKKVQILANGRPIRTLNCTDNVLAVKVPVKPMEYTVYTVRVIEPVTEQAFGTVRPLAISSPIYAEPYIVVDPSVKPEQARVRITPSRVKDAAVAPGDSAKPFAVYKGEEWAPPTDAQELVPQWVY